MFGSIGLGFISNIAGLSKGGSGLLKRTGKAVEDCTHAFDLYVSERQSIEYFG